MIIILDMHNHWLYVIFWQENIYIFNNKSVIESYMYYDYLISLSIELKTFLPYIKNEINIAKC